MSSARAEYFCEHAWLGGPTTEADVLVSVEGDRIVGVHLGGRPRRRPALRTCGGLTLAGLGQLPTRMHFHRALTGP